MNTKVCHKLKFSLFLAVLISCLATFISCSNLFDDIETPDSDAVTVTLNGTVRSVFSETGAVPAEYAALFMQSDETDSRAAIPTMPTGCTTTVSATADDGDTIASQTLTENTFTLPLVSGKKWTVSVTMKNNGTPILSDSKEFDLTGGGAVSHEFVLKPVTDGTGNISLTLAIEATSIKYILITISDQSTIAWTQNTISGNTNYGKWAPTGSTSYVINPTITLSNVNSGVYTATMRFYSGNDNNKALIYSTSQEINVLPTLTTNKWVSGGDVSDTLTITPTMVDTYGRTDFFVGDCGTATPDDTNGTGSPYKPLATITKAISLISTMPTGEYTIHVKDGTTEDISSTIQINKNITIECWKNTTGDTLGIATLKWNGTSAGLMVQIISGGTLTITGDKTADETWSGLVLDGNKSEKTAEGIGITNGGTLNLNGGAIKNCNATLSQRYGVALNLSGGAVVIMNGGKISENNANGGMGTVYLGSTDTNYPSFTMAGGIICDNNYTGSASYSPGVYISKGSFTMKDDGEITRNISSYYAGGIYISNNENAAFSMTGGKIYSNTAENKGSAIYNQGKLFISGSAYIAPDNDVYLTSGKTITIAGELTPPPEASGITATITPSSTTSGTAVLALADGVTDTSISKERVKFNVSGTNLFINTNGCLGNADISISSTTDQTALGNAFETNDTVIVNLQSDYVPKPLETYSNGGDFSDGGKDCVVDIPAGKTLVLSSDTPVTLEPSVFSGYFFDVKGTLIIGPNITISGKSGNTSRLHWNIIAVKSGGKVILKGGTIKDNTSGGSTVGAVRIFGGGIFTMESGLITDSRGGVYVHENGTFVMNGGEISNNTSSGVIVNNNGIFIKTEGSVKNNTNSSKPDQSQMLIMAGGKYGTSEETLTAYTEDTGFADAF